MHELDCCGLLCRYSGKHARLRPTQDEYWDFSLDEMARFDVPAMVDYVLKSTGHAQLAYVGFSNVRAVPRARA